MIAICFLLFGDWMLEVYIPQCAFVMTRRALCPAIEVSWGGFSEGCLQLLDEKCDIFPAFRIGFGSLGWYEKSLGL